jgi:hypothetical protein
MDDAHAVRLGQALADLAGQADGGSDPELAAHADHALQVLALDVLHGDEMDAVRLAQVEHPADIAMRDLAGQPQLVAETLQDRGVGDDLGADDLERDFLVDGPVFRPIDMAHPPAAEAFDDFVAAGEHLTALAVARRPGRRPGAVGRRLIGRSQTGPAVGAERRRIGILGMALRAFFRQGAPRVGGEMNVPSLRGNVNERRPAALVKPGRNRRRERPRRWGSGLGRGTRPRPTRPSAAPVRRADGRLTPGWRTCEEDIADGKVPAEDHVEEEEPDEQFYLVQGVDVDADPPWPPAKKRPVKTMARPASADDPLEEDIVEEAAEDELLDDGHQDGFTDDLEDFDQADLNRTPELRDVEEQDEEPVGHDDEEDEDAELSQSQFSLMGWMRSPNMTRPPSLRSRSEPRPGRSLCSVGSGRDSYGNSGAGSYGPEVKGD